MHILKKNLDIVIYCILLISLVVYAVTPSAVFSKSQEALLVSQTIESQQTNK